MSIIIGIDHGYYAIKTAHCSFPAGLTSYGEHEPYTRQGLLEFGGCFFVCGSGRQPIQRDKTINDNYYLLTLAAIAKEIQQRGLPPECSVRIAAGLPLTSFGRDKPKFRDYLLRSKQPVNFRFEGVEYSITIEEVAIFPQGYAALRSGAFAGRTVHIDKTDIAGNLLPGATLTIRDANDEIIDTWTTDYKTHRVPISDDFLKLSDDSKEYIYTLTEDAAPAGFEIAESVQFKLESVDDVISLFVRENADAEWTRSRPRMN